MVKGMELGFPHRSAVVFHDSEAQPVLNWETPDPGGHCSGLQTHDPVLWFLCLGLDWSLSGLGVHHTLSPGDQSLLLLGLPMGTESLSTASLGLACHLVQVWVEGAVHPRDQAHPNPLPPLTQLPEDTGSSGCGPRASQAREFFGDQYLPWPDVMVHGV